ncbi:MAG TPA: hypothetical protein VEI83_01495, partial [Acidimicrobiales bacterium]|nr:hypothetical protein [Acidimicrobiales bacterium]
MQLVTSAPVEAAAQHQLGALETVGASEVGQSNLIAINSTNARPARAATIANAYAKAMVDYESSLALQSLTAAETQLQTQITNLEQEAGAAVLPAQATALQNQIALLKADLAQLEVSSATTNGGVQLVSPAV